MKHMTSVFLVAVAGLFCMPPTLAQTNIFLTNPVAQQILLGNYNPADYAATTVIDDESSILCNLKSGISADSLKSYLIKLETFQNRNSGSDTVSSTTGIGATRRWAVQKFDQFSAASENRLVTSFLQWDENICGMPQHRNMLAVLPGSDLSDGSIIIIEGHVDSRCEGACDIICDAPGMEDNGSGSALVLEMARVMSRYTFPNTIVFMLTIGEEQGLFGANAFAQYVFDNNISVKAVQNNDVVGGILCGATSSGPSCPFEGHVDSTNVRIFSDGNILQTQIRGYARYAKLVNDEKLTPISSVPMTVNIINQIDRTGRGGDHIPFSKSPRFNTAIRFCAANEHGDAGVTAPGYSDRQHTETDALGVDTDADGVIDSFFVDFNYLKRNCILNGATAALASHGPETPDYTLVNDSNGFTVQITSATQYLNYRVGVNTTSQLTEFVALYRFTDTLEYRVPGLDAGTQYLITVAAVDSNGITSMFSSAIFPPVSPIVSTDSAAQDDLPYSFVCNTVSVAETAAPFVSGISMLCVPNPTSGTARFIVNIERKLNYKESQILVTNLAGKVVRQLPVALSVGSNEVMFNGNELPAGIYTYSLVTDGLTMITKKFSLMK
ncbi:MAG: M28 family peptidase [Flavobacteriales bacterium]|nr:M28 family peptidase [Flavobacteriales bacterium]